MKEEMNRQVSARTDQAVCQSVCLSVGRSTCVCIK